MSTLRYSTSMSLDGFVAGPEQSTENPLGLRGELLHAWMRELAVWRSQAGLAGGVTNASTPVLEGEDVNIGAIIMGRNMFGGGPGPWPEEPWNGWWGDNPPFHLPVIVLTHYPREPLECEGGTTFTFVTEGLSTALDEAKERSRELDVAIAGGAGVARQFLASGLVDEIMIHLVPVLLGGGVRLFDDPSTATTRIDQVGVVEAPGVTHLSYRIFR